jgi:iron complex outermembrane receptor protein
MANLEGNGWSGNAGLRVVQTKVNVLTNVAIPQNPTGNPATPTDCAPLAPCSVPGAITTSAFGAFYRQPVANTHNDVLPSLNLRTRVNREMDLVAGIARTMARPDFSALGGSVSLDDLNRTGNGGNPNLKPVRSNNYNVGLEWYFARRALLQAGLFHMDLTSYVSFGVSQASYFNQQTGTFQTYNVSSPINTKGKVSGLELGWQQPIANNFGAIVNYTFADGEEQSGAPLVGTSKHTYNLVGYFENETFNARLAYNYRSAFFNGLDRATAQNQAATATLAATLGWKINDSLSLNFDAMNLNNPVLKYYAANTSQPTAFYVNGRQYYLTLRARM